VIHIQEILDCLQRQTNEPLAVTSSTERVVTETCQKVSTDLSAMAAIVATSAQRRDSSGGTGSHGSRKSSLSSSSSGCPPGQGSGLSPSHQTVNIPIPIYS